MAKRKRSGSAAVVDVPLLFESPESSNIRSASYDPITETMTIHFQHGDAYDYTGFPLKMWTEFAQANSKGRYFAGAIRPLFAGVKR